MESVQVDDFNTIRRALALRKRGLIGVLWADGGKFYISESEFDPHGTRLRVSLEKLGQLVAEIEAAHGAVAPARRAAASEAIGTLVRKATA